MNNEQVNFSEKDYDNYLKSRTAVHNERYRDETESIFDVLKSDEADFTKTAEGMAALEAIIAFGKNNG